MKPESLTAMKKLPKTPYLSNLADSEARRELRRFRKQYRLLVEQLGRSERAVDSLTEILTRSNNKVCQLRAELKEAQRQCPDTR